MRAPEVRLIDGSGKQLGVMSLTEALKKGHENELDLVEIAPDAKPPVVKIIDYKKFKYLEERKLKEARKKTKETELKEVRFSPFIGDHDLETGLKKVRKFLSEGDLVKISIVFKGRQMAHTEFGPKLLKRILEILGESVQKEREPIFQGRRYITIVKSIKTDQFKKEVNNEAKTKKSSSKKVQNNPERENHKGSTDELPPKSGKK